MKTLTVTKCAECPFRIHGDGMPPMQLVQFGKSYPYWDKCVRSNINFLVEEFDMESVHPDCKLPEWMKDG
jgi:hypothetical protein